KALKYATIFLASSLLMGSSSCSLTREQIDAISWPVNAKYWQEETDACDRIPELHLMGFGRTLDNGKVEFISWCNPLAQEIVAFKETELLNLINATLPKGATNVEK